MIFISYKGKETNETKILQLLFLIYISWVSFLWLMYNKNSINNGFIWK